MQQILANYSASVSEFKKSPSKILKQAQGESVAILSHNSVNGYFVPSELYAELLEIKEDFLLGKKLNKRLNDGQKPIFVDIDAL